MTRVLLSAALLTITSCTTPNTTVTDTPTPTGTPDTTPTPTPTTVSPAATATSPATRLNPSSSVEQAAPFDPVAHVNSLPYGWQNMAPAMDAYRVVAHTRGWTQASIDRWTPFVYDVIVKESGGCWNTKGGDLYVVGTCDQYTRHGNSEDSGFGQLTSALWGRGGLVCVHDGYCSQASIISSPWASMDALVAALEHAGRFSWCDYKNAPDLHDCTLVGRDERPVAA